MSNSQRFDEHIQEQFQDYTPQVHPRIWDNIVKEREKRRPVGFWFNFFNSKNIFLFSGLLIAAATGSYVLLNQSAKTTITGSTVISKNTVQPSTSSNTTNTNSNKDIPGIPGHSGNAGNFITQSATISDNNNTKNIAGNPTRPGSLFASSVTKIKIYSPFAQEDEDQTASSKKRNSKARSTGNEYGISGTDIAASSGAAQENQLTKLYFIAEKTNTEKQALLLKKNALPNIFLPGCPSLEKDAAGNKAYVEIYGGPDMAFRNLSDTGNSTYLQKRKESTSFTSAYSAGLRYTRVFSNGMSIRTGINYSQINEKFTYVQGNLVQVTYIIAANGDTTGSYTTTGTRYKTTHNKFRTIDVPLVMGYEMGNGKIHANINAGIIVNAYSWQKGEVLDTALMPVSINTGKASSPYQFKTNIGLGFLAGVSLYYKLNEKVHILAEPYFRYSLTPMSKENLTFKQKYNTAGLRLGIRIDLH